MLDKVVTSSPHHLVTPSPHHLVIPHGWVFYIGMFLGERLKPRLVAFRRASACADAHRIRMRSIHAGGWLAAGPQARFQSPASTITAGRPTVVKNLHL